MIVPYLEVIEREFVSAFGRVVAERKAGRLEALLNNARIHRSGERLELWATVLLMSFDGENLVVDVKEQELFLGTIDPATADAKWGDEMTAATKAIAAGLSSALERAAANPEMPQPADVWPLLPVPHLLVTWATQGPPPPRPDRFATSDVKVAARLRALKKAEWTALEKKLGGDAEPVVMGFALDGWTILVCMEQVDENDLGRVVVSSPSGELGTFFVNEVDGSQSMSALPIDADTVTLRGVLEWLGRVVASAELDNRFEVDEDHPAHGLTLSQWLRFRDRDGPQIDWRVQGDSVGEGPLRDGHDPALRTEEGRANASLFSREHSLDEVLVYDRFIRTFIDPTFVSKPA